MSIRGAEQTNSSSLKAILQPIFCIDSKYTNCKYTNRQEVKNYIKFIKRINKLIKNYIKFIKIINKIY